MKQVPTHQPGTNGRAKTTEYDQALAMVERLDTGRAHCRRLDTGELIEDMGLAVILTVAGLAVIGSRAEFEAVRARRQIIPAFSRVLIPSALRPELIEGEVIL